MNKLFCDNQLGTCGENVGKSEKDVSLSSKKIVVKYFTDPICSACWIAEKTISTFCKEHKEIISFQIVMGGLLESWETYSGGGISSATDVAKHWDEMAEHFKMTFDGTVWRKDPPNSSYPPSIAFIAAKRQGDEVAAKFLHLCRESIFLGNNNISRHDVLMGIAAKSGLDMQKFVSDFSSPNTLKLFEKDLKHTRDCGVGSFPTMLFCKGQKSKAVVGVCSIDKYIKALNFVL